ncbi:MAG: transcriptional regulator [Rhodospirillaceae bacterium]|jgi:putative transcriptional regulator|nr:transcriptional regulator [Rhodospirillaceae bacterium]MBT3883860.1 transcriptional regulator [Rhodospirillaceae bacterium]MBT4117832.1 transcriptional regulator [Rhodospirillaceae bacterium]MBT4672960.1 transcriptional regulator [Rhodospirillaceae bacterium]MBT6292352.1 transcriptional regulator [Rhodospirillaceae bacterium]
MTKAGDKILAGLESALEYAKGNTEGSITHEIEVIDVKEVRKSLGMTQAVFANTFHIPAGTLRGWEQKRRQPEGPAKVLMFLIAKEAKAVKRALKVT